MSKPKSNAQLEAYIEVLKASLAQAAEDAAGQQRRIEELEIALGAADAECARKERIIQMLRKRPTAEEFKQATGRDYVPPHRRPALSGRAKLAADYCRIHGVRTVDAGTLDAWIAAQAEAK